MWADLLPTKITCKDTEIYTHPFCNKERFWSSDILVF